MMIKQGTGRIAQIATSVDENMELQNPQAQPEVKAEEKNDNTFTVPGLTEDDN